MDEDSEIRVGDRRISDLKVVELKEELGKRGLSKIGNKNVLYDRLKEYIMDNGAKVSGREEAAEETAKQGSSDNPLIAEYLAKQEAMLKEARKDADVARHLADTTEPSPATEPRVIEPRRRRSSRRTTAHAESIDTTTSHDEEEKKEEEIKLNSSSDEHEVFAQNEEVEDQNVGAETIKQIDVEASTEREADAELLETLEADTDASKTDKTELLEHKELEVSSLPENEKILIATIHEVLLDSVEVNDRTTEQITDNEEDMETDDHEEKGEKRSDSQEETLHKRFVDEDEEVKEEEMEVDSRSPKQNVVEDDKSNSENDVKSEENDDEEEKMDSEDEKISASASSVEGSDNEDTDKRSEESLNEREGGDHILAVTESDLAPTTREDAVYRKRRWKGSTSDNQKMSNVVRVSVQHLEDSEELVDKASPAKEDKYAEKSEDDEYMAAKEDIREKIEEELDYEEAHLDEVEKVNEDFVGLKETRRRPEKFSKDDKLKDLDTGQLISLKFKEKKEPITEDGLVRQRSLSPPRYPMSNIIMIRQLTRPFTVKQLQEQLKTYGEIVEGGFWIDNIKSTCIVKFATVEQAVIARGRLHNVIWPSCSPKALKVDYADEACLARHMESASNASTKNLVSADDKKPSSLRVLLSGNLEQREVHPSSGHERSLPDIEVKKIDSEKEKVQRKRKLSRSHEPVEKRTRHSPPLRFERRNKSPDKGAHKDETKNKEPEKKKKTADELFQKTKTQPAIYFLPLTESQIQEKAKKKEAEMAIKKSAAASQNSVGKSAKSESAGGKTERTSSKRISAPGQTRSPLRSRGHSSRSPRRRH